MRHIAFAVMLLTFPVITAIAQKAAPAPLRPPRKPGHYTTQEWHALINLLWGSGREVALLVDARRPPFPSGSGSLPCLYLSLGLAGIRPIH
jgi:hypothetical protein